MTTDSIKEKIERSRTELLDLSLRNRLLNYKLLKAKGVEAVGAKPVKIFETLLRNNPPMQFLDVKSKSSRNNRIRTAETSDQLGRRLLRTYYDANTLIQEQGVNTLFMALGMVSWYESDSSEQERKAPLILVPVRLERDNANAGFKVIYTGEELGANIAFVQKARQDFGIEIPGLADEEETDAEDIDIDAYFTDVSRSIKGMKRWAVDYNSVVLGFFSFNKLLMYRDLDPNSWPENGGLPGNHIIHALLEGGFQEAPSEIGEGDFLDDHLKPDDAHHVVDADSSQAKAIHNVDSGRNMVIQGPPGTGKSQTITNIIAESIGQGKTVLFVAEKMAALEVVKRRLDGIGIGVACLELHSHKTQKKAVIDDLGKTLELGKPSMEGIEDDFITLTEHRDRLNRYAAAVNTPVGDTGVSPYHTYGELSRIKTGENGVRLRRVQIPNIASWANADFQRKMGAVSEIQTLLGSVGVPKEHIFRGSQLRLVTPEQEEDLREGLTAAAVSIDTLKDAARHLSEALGLDAPEDIRQVEAILPLAERAAQAPNIEGVNLRALKSHGCRRELQKLMSYQEHLEQLHSKKYDAALKPDAWEADVSEAHRILSNTESVLWRSLISPKYLCARNQLADLYWYAPPGDVGALNTIAELARALSEALGLDAPEDIRQVEAILPLAERAAQAPNIEGANLRALKSHGCRRELQKLLSYQEHLEQLHSKYDAALKPDAWEADVSEAHRILSTTGRSFWGRLFSSGYRRSRKQIMDLCHGEQAFNVERQIALAEAIFAEQQTRQNIARLSPTAKEVFGQKWQFEYSDWKGSDWKAIERIAEWALALLEDVDNGSVDSTLAFDMSAEWDPARVNTLRIQTLDALSNYRAIIKIECSDTNIERQIALAEAILDEQQTRRNVATLSPTAKEVFGQKWHFEYSGWKGSDWKAIERIAEWALALLEDVDNGNVDSTLAFDMSDKINASKVNDFRKQAQSARASHAEHIANLETLLKIDNSKQFGNPDGLNAMPFMRQKGVIAEWQSGVNTIRDMAGFNAAASNVVDEDMAEVVDLAWEWPEASEYLSACFEKARYSAILSRALKERDCLVGFNGDVHQQIIDKFREMDELALANNRTRVSHVHWESLPKYGGGGQLGILRREIAKRRRHLSIRQLMEQAGKAVQAIKPVFMMSPLSVATYLKLGSVKFDIVVFDEASQVKPVDALGALIRGKQAVVVGDDKQLPPTDFFNAVNQDDDSDDAATADMESILSLFSAQGAPSSMLRWHYRSRHESLIAVSNSEFYDNRLVVFPSPDKEKQDLGLQYHYLDTKYGGSGRNREEAQQVAEAVMRHARQHPELSLGVATFSSSQRDEVQDALEALRRQDNALEQFFNNDHPNEPFFIKNLENVQGDERDVIFISVGYGRNSNGRVLQNFGPLNKDGGERRLNVLISRAKRRCHVFTNLHADDIRATVNSGHGVRAFKKFLAYAEQGEMPDMPMMSGREVDSPFQIEVAGRLRSHGYEIHDEVASSGYFVDIGVVDPKRPGRYALGIECDGATYHSSRSARDRDRIREAALVGLGWRIHRVWSTDWFNNPERELKRATAAIEDALTSRQNAGKSSAKPIPNESVISRADVKQENRIPDIPLYRLAQPNVDIGFHELGDAPVECLIEPVIEVVRVESPVQDDEVIRRIANAAGVARVGTKIQGKIYWAIEDAVRRKQVIRKGYFIWANDIERPLVRDRSNLERERKNIEYISPEEIAEAVRMVVERSFGIDREEAIRNAANLLGFRRVTGYIDYKLGEILDRMLEDERIKRDGNHLTLSE